MSEELKTNRIDDNRRSLVVNNFLDKRLYSNSDFKNVVRETTKEQQYLGVDIEFDLLGEHYICDEKAATDYINKDKPLGTFVLELSSLQGKNKVLRDGWFVKDDNINNSYLFVWVDKAKTDNLSGGDEDITQCEALLVKKEVIIKYLEYEGLTIQKLKQKAYDIRYNGDTDFGMMYRDGYKFSYTKTKPEEPINILISRDIYRLISTYKFEMH